MPRTPSGNTRSASPCASRRVAFSGTPTTCPTRAKEPWRLAVHEERGGDERAVDGHLTRMVRDEEHAARGHAADAVHLGPEVFSMERRHREDHVLHPLGVEAERIDPRAAERERDARHALGERLAEEA